MIVKHFACKEKKKVEFQYRNDESKDDNSDKVVEDTKDNSMDDKNSEENKFEGLDKSKDSEYTKPPEKDESVDNGKKEF